MLIFRIDKPEFRPAGIGKNFLCGVGLGTAMGNRGGIFIERPYSCTQMPYRRLAVSLKATFAIDDGVLRDAREYVENNHIKSLSAFVERSIREELTRMRQEKIRNDQFAAGSDRLFMADVLEIQQAFEHADLEA